MNGIADVGEKCIFTAVTDFADYYTKHNGETVEVIHKIGSTNQVKNESSDIWYATNGELTPVSPSASSTKSNTVSRLVYEDSSWYEGVEVKVLQTQTVWSKHVVHLIELPNGNRTVVSSDNLVHSLRSKEKTSRV